MHPLLHRCLHLLLLEVPEVVYDVDINTFFRNNLTTKCVVGKITIGMI